MSKNVITLELPTSLYEKLKALAAGDQRDPVAVIAELVEQRLQVADPVFELIGAYRSQQLLIDGIPVSEDPDLYLLAETMGSDAYARHAWEIAPQRYDQGPDGRPVRRIDPLS